MPHRSSRRRSATATAAAILSRQQHRGRSTTTSSWCSRACRSTCRRAASSRCSAPTAPARPPRSRRSPTCCTPSAARSPRARSCSTARRCRRCSPNELVRRGCIQVMEGRHCFGHLTIEENLLTGAFTRRDGKAAIRRDLELRLHLFPAPEGAAHVARRLHLRRRAADVRDRPRADVAAEDDPARRALDGARAADRRGDLRDRARPQRARKACRSCWPSRTPTWR